MTLMQLLIKDAFLGGKLLIRELPTITLYNYIFFLLVTRKKGFYGVSVHHASSQLTLYGFLLRQNGALMVLVSD